MSKKPASLSYSITASSTLRTNNRIKSSVPLLIPKSSIPSTLLVQISDKKLNLNDDSGVTVGRLKAKNSDMFNLNIDIQGQIYQGKLFNCSTVMLVSCNNSKATIEGIADCICHTTSIGNLHSNESYSGDLNLNSNNAIDQLDENVNLEWKLEEKEKKRQKTNKIKKKKQNK